MTRVWVDIDPDEVLREASTSSLIAELRERAASGDEDAKVAVGIGVGDVLSKSQLKDAALALAAGDADEFMAIVGGAISPPRDKAPLFAKLPRDPQTGRPLIM